MFAHLRQQLLTTPSTNPLVTMTQAAKRLPHWALTIPISAFGVLIGLVAGSFIASGVFIALGITTVTTDTLTVGLIATLSLLLPFGVILVVFWLWVRFYEQRPFWTMGLPRAGAVAEFGIGWATGALMFGAVYMLLMFGGVLTPSDGGLATNAGPTVLAVGMILLGYLLQGSAEEIVFRGWLLPVIAAKQSVWLAVVVSSLMFAALHALNPGITALPILNLILFGVFAAVVALWRGDVWLICGIHAAWNWVQGQVFGIAVSGGTNPISLITTSANAAMPEWWSGGAFGAEGSIAASIVLLAGIGVVLVLWQRQHRAAVA
jgi:uncharacterized protein